MLCTKCYACCVGNLIWPIIISVLIAGDSSPIPPERLSKGAPGDSGENGGPGRDGNPGLKGNPGKFIVF